MITAKPLKIKELRLPPSPETATEIEPSLNQIETKSLSNSNQSNTKRLELLSKLDSLTKGIVLKRKYTRKEYPPIGKSKLYTILVEKAPGEDAATYELLALRFYKVFKLTHRFNDGYNTLNALVRANVLTRIKVNGSYRYFRRVT